MIVLCSTSRVIKNRHFDGISVLLCREHRYHLTARIFCNHSHDRHSTNCFWSPIDVSLYGTNRLPCIAPCDYLHIETVSGIFIINPIGDMFSWAGHVSSSDDQPGNFKCTKIPVQITFVLME